MSQQYIKFDRQDIQTLLGLIDEIDPQDRSEQEDKLYEKALQIRELQLTSSHRDQPSLIIDPDTARLTIQVGSKRSEPTSYKGIARLGTLFAVTDYYEGIFPTNTLLRYFKVQSASPESTTTKLTKTLQAKGN